MASYRFKVFALVSLALLCRSASSRLLAELPSSNGTNPGPGPAPGPDNIYYEYTYYELVPAPAPSSDEADHEYPNYDPEDVVVTIGMPEDPIPFEYPEHLNPEVNMFTSNFSEVMAVGEPIEAAAPTNGSSSASGDGDLYYPEYDPENPAEPVETGRLLHENNLQLNVTDPASWEHHQTLSELPDPELNQTHLVVLDLEQDDPQVYDASELDTTHPEWVDPELDEMHLQWFNPELNETFSEWMVPGLD